MKKVTDLYIDLDYHIFRRGKKEEIYGSSEG